MSRIGLRGMFRFERGWRWCEFGRLWLFLLGVGSLREGIGGLALGLAGRFGVGWMDIMHMTNTRWMQY